MGAHVQRYNGKRRVEHCGYPQISYSYVKNVWKMSLTILLFSLDWAASPRPRRTERTVGPGGLQTRCMVPTLWCVTWSLTACSPSGSKAAETPCSAPTALRSPSTPPLHLVSSTRLLTFSRKCIAHVGLFPPMMGVCSWSVLWVLSWT